MVVVNLVEDGATCCEWSLLYCIERLAFMLPANIACWLELFCCDEAAAAAEKDIRFDALWAAAA